MSTSMRSFPASSVISEMHPNQVGPSTCPPGWQRPGLAIPVCREGCGQTCPCPGTTCAHTCTSSTLRLGGRGATDGQQSSWSHTCSSCLVPGEPVADHRRTQEQQGAGAARVSILVNETLAAAAMVALGFTPLTWRDAWQPLQHCVVQSSEHVKPRTRVAQG